MDRSVVHIDIAAFSVAVERIVDPRLRLRPVAIAPAGSARAPVLCASAEAGREGVRPGMPVPAALRRCPDLIVLPVNEPLYRRASAAVLALLAGFSPLVEPRAHGQAFADLTGTARLFGAAQDTAARIRREIAERLRLRATAGVAANKLVSRVAARLVRPDGMCDIFPGAEEPFLAPLPVGCLPDAAPPEVRRVCADLGLRRVADLAALSPPQARTGFGPLGDRLRRQALGIDDSPVRPPPASPAVTVDETLAEDSNVEAVVMRTLYGVCEQAGARLRRLGAAARRLTVSARHADAVITRREARLRPPAAADRVLFAACGPLLEPALARRVRVRWIEVRCADLVRGPRQLGLFGPEAWAPGAAGDPASGRGRDGAAEALAEAVDRIRGRFGDGALVAGRRFDGRA